MENASKALIMAGTVLITLMIIGALVLMFNNLTAYQQSNNIEIENEEVIEFKSGYATYIRKDVRGSDLISLIHKVVDYNNRKTEAGYIKMKISITGIDISKNSPLKYDTSANRTKLIEASYNEDNLDSKLIEPVQKLESDYQQKYISELASNISNIMKTAPGSNENTQKYYEYQQFKRSYFDINGQPTYDSKTGRIVEIKFKYVRTGE